MEIAQRARSFPILFSTLVIGLSPLIPVPIVDDLMTAALCRWRVKYLAARCGLRLPKEEIKILADEQQLGFLGGVTRRAFGYIFKEFWDALLPWLEAGRTIDLLSRTYYYGILLDFAFYKGLYKGGNRAEARRLSYHICEVRKGANLRQLQALFRASSKGTKKLSLSFMKDITELYFKSIVLGFRRQKRRLLRQQEQFNERADQATEKLGEAAPSWVRRYQVLFDEFGCDLATISDRELENLCLALEGRMTQAAPRETSPA